MQTSHPLLTDVQRALKEGGDAKRVLQLALEHLHADGGTVHLLGADGRLHLAAALPAMPPPLLEKIRVIPVGKGMAGLAVERAQPVSACNLQTDTTGDVRPGAKQTGFQGSTCVPIFEGHHAVGALGIGTAAERTFSDEENALLMDVGRALAKLRKG